MKYIFSPKTFTVKEIFNPELKEEGKYHYYLLEKRGVSHKQALKKIPGNKWFSGIKDRNASTLQWICTDRKLSEEEMKKIK